MIASSSAWLDRGCEESGPKYRGTRQEQQKTRLGPARASADDARAAADSLLVGIAARTICCLGDLRLDDQVHRRLLAFRTLAVLERCIVCLELPLVNDSQLPINGTSMPDGQEPRARSLRSEIVMLVSSSEMTRGVARSGPSNRTLVICAAAAQTRPRPSVAGVSA
eukprot:CAMPEP_0115845726 /NCGR_PEP_ID=MMETSP0287-20121206/9503_1 /TAXON_ID=412157 /ORGANISM="Chrysochromulina rotalis, Strain UIO044" /LENGTH=165 /DNA_ID=CAMNT_0003299513 /DNA_START=291 /DNA_END=789 /DNA_ORIENTATION=-